MRALSDLVGFVSFVPCVFAESGNLPPVVVVLFVIPFPGSFQRAAPCREISCFMPTGDTSFIAFVESFIAFS